MRAKKINWKVLVLSLIIVYGIAFLGSLFTSSNVNTEWYEQTRNSLTPPNYVFPIVWNILFFLIAISLYFAWTNAKKKDKKEIGYVFGLNLVLNVLWSVLFFGLQNPIASFVELIVLWISILLMIIVVYKTSKLSAYLLIPYLLWVSFAGILNYLIAFA